MDTATNTSDTIDAKALLENVADSMDVTAAKKPAPKLSKMDLSYMLNWDPNKRPSMSPKRERNIDTIKPVVKHEQNESNNKVPTPAAENVEEGRSNGSAASVVTSTLTSVHSNAAKTSHSHMSLHTHKSDGSDDANTAHLPTTVEPTASLDQKALRVAKSNPDFLPLVSEDNILRVNNVPYAKLGVIGKGGSCKVYRALAKDCSILAIKKVKLGGMDKKAINGYANEIALLKRLRGNPAIIQMYDSEVDLSRKAIYLCMELGEVDLSQVIQQQTMGTSTRDGKTSRSTLDMNFIRLTWQQMLKAVHSIHEERIIHGDLKPANFLFVRGALKLIDFGIAKAIQSDDTTNIYRDSQIGTLNYMSPEAILDTGSGTNGARMRIGRVSLFVIWNFEI
jgi:serine/threonine protein kinase